MNRACRDCRGGREQGGCSATAASRRLARGFRRGRASSRVAKNACDPYTTMSPARATGLLRACATRARRARRTGAGVSRAAAGACCARGRSCVETLRLRALCADAASRSVVDSTRCRVDDAAACSGGCSYCSCRSFFGYSTVPYSCRLLLPSGHHDMMSLVLYSTRVHVRQFRDSATVAM